MKHSITPELVLLPLTLVAVAVSIEYRTITFPQSIVEVSLVSIAIARNVDPLSVNLVTAPLAIADRAVLKKHFSDPGSLVLEPFTIIYGPVLVIVDASSLPDDFTYVLCTVIIVQLIYVWKHLKLMRAYF